MLQIDLQHTDHLGVAQWLVAAALLYFENALEHPPGDWQCKYNRAPRDLYFDFKDWCKQYGYESSQRQFGVAMISMSDGQQCWPEFKASRITRMLLVGGVPAKRMISSQWSRS